MSAVMRGRVIDAGGGEVCVLWDRDQTFDYPSIGATVEFTVVSPPPPQAQTVFDVVVPALTATIGFGAWDMAESVVYALRQAGMLMEDRP